MNNPRRSKFNTVDVSAVHSNLGQEIIEITSDKLKIILNEYIYSISARKEWQTPLSILITITIVLCTTNFKSFAGFTADTWASVFIMSATLSFIWLINTLMKLKKSITIEDVLDAAKNKV